MSHSNYLHGITALTTSYGHRTLYGDFVKLIIYIYRKINPVKPLNYVLPDTLSGSDITIKIDGEIAETVVSLNWHLDSDKWTLDLIECIPEREFDRSTTKRIELSANINGKHITKYFVVEHTGESSGVSVDDLVLEKTTFFNILESSLFA